MELWKDKEAAMDITFKEFRELKEMRENIRQKINSLELCWSCQKICECEQWLVNESVPVWLCGQCVSEVSYRLTEETGMPLSLSAHCG